MENSVPIEKLSNVPIKAEMAIGENWGEMKKINAK
jgi:hypothetical protein